MKETKGRLNNEVYFEIIFYTEYSNLLIFYPHIIYKKYFAVLTKAVGEQKFISKELPAENNKLFIIEIKALSTTNKQEQYVLENSFNDLYKDDIKTLCMINKHTDRLRSNDEEFRWGSHRCDS